ncbi:TMV resistance protein N-like [Daucus carota subsp. sativus]|uniref:TMV resistance protein N-like n=1 Tax=Daucus carota subsp. sativus TaxID=79200 RepID=UPI0007EF661D|nr:PREDICTED: TMV resistance protein N-like [Daucus carota subsp. sativus]
MKRWVIVVFYSIHPLVVRHETWKFKEAFEIHQAGSFPCISGNRSEADVINETVDEILLNINSKGLDVAKHPVGLESRVKEITILLSSDTEGVVRMGIYGMVGIGKTTLAKALYNQLLLGSYTGTSFLANVREISGTTNGLVSLQQQLISDVLKNEHKQFESLVGPFAPGSVVIITTRDEEILDTIDVETRYRYRVNELDDAESLALFTRHAFGNDKPNNT